MHSTVVTSLLAARGIQYRLLTHSRPVYTVADAAQERGVDPETMVKSILLREKGGSRRFILACVLGLARIDLKAVRRAMGSTWKRLTFATPEEILEVTGFPQGAVAPVALRSRIHILFDEGIQKAPAVNISSGDPSAGLELATADLLGLCNPKVERIRAHR